MVQKASDCLVQLSHHLAFRLSEVGMREMGYIIVSSRSASEQLYIMRRARTSIMRVDSVADTAEFLAVSFALTSERPML